MNPPDERAKGPATGSVPVAIYTRVSTLNQVGGRFDSCESQAYICREFIRKHAAEGWYEAACYTDAAYSGGTMDRPGIRALKRQIEAGTIKVVLIFKLERILRNTDEWALFRSFLQRHDCRLVSTTEDLTEETPSGRLKNNIIVSVSEYERLNTAEKVRAKLAALTERGIWNCGLVPYGYDYEKERKELHPNPVESEVVRGIFEKAASLVSLTDIANGLNDAGHRTRSRLFKRRTGAVDDVGGKRFRSDLLRNMVRNPIYKGLLRFHGREHTGNHQALVTAELWERANAAIKASLKPARCFRPARNKNNHLLKGLVHCRQCGMAMIPTIGGKRDADGIYYRYYICGNAHKERADSPCKVRSVPAQALEAAVIRFIGAVGRHPDVLAHAMRESRITDQAERAALVLRRKEIDGELGMIDERIRNCMDIIAGGGAGALTEELRATAARLRDEKDGHLVAREQVRQELRAFDQPAMDRERILEALGRFERHFPRLTAEEQRELVLLCVKRVEIADKPLVGGQARARQSLEIQVTVPVGALVRGMEERRVGGLRVDEPVLAARPVTLEMRLAIRTRAFPAQARILKPFSEEVLLEEATPGAAAARAEPEAGPSHPFFRAVAWQRTLDRNPELSQVELARQAGVTAATMCVHLGLLKLAPAVQDFLFHGAAEKELHMCSLRRLRAVAALPAREQLAEFRRLCPGFGLRASSVGAELGAEGVAHRPPGAGALKQGHAA